MPRKISKKTRDQAILVLDIAACHAYDTVGEDEDPMIVDDVIAALLGVSRMTCWLVWQAYCQTPDMSSQGRGDAAGLLRDGWCPGDPVEQVRR